MRLAIETAMTALRRWLDRHDSLTLPTVLRCPHQRGGDGMSWDAIGAVGQAVSALPLVLVLIQLRHAREEMQRTAGRARLEGTRDMFALQATHPDLASLFVRAHKAAGGEPGPFAQYVIGLGLTDVEARQLGSNVMAIWQNVQVAIESAGRLSSGVRDELRGSIRANFGGQSVIGSKWFELTKGRLNPNAVHYVEEVLTGAG
jgi:hypothetical protein